MNEREQSLTFTVVCIVLLLAFALGYLIGQGCTETKYTVQTKRDTITTVQIIPRQPFSKPDVKVKTILVPYLDTILLTSKLPCDSSFILQSDSVLTTTGDTVNMSLTHNKENTFFSFMLRPRPDSILTKTIEIPVVKEVNNTDFAWLISAFAIGIGIGIYGAHK